jgi:S-adenosylmethionine-diacylglycerol 3-amino-3-carboxypropyl transferase
LVDASFVEPLRTCADGSIAGFSLSDICERMSSGDIDELFGEIARTARPGASLCFRNLAGRTDVPGRWQRQVCARGEEGTALRKRDRTFFQRRIALCAVNEDASGSRGTATAVIR